MLYSTDFLKELYATMQRIRYSQECLVEPILKGEIRCPVHLYSGQEAVATGVCASLEKTDYVFGNHRSHGYYLAKGGDLKQLFAEVYCRDAGCSGGRGGSMHISSPENGVIGMGPSVGGTISLAMGAALASKVRGDNRITVSFFGDGATGSGVLYEVMNFASLKKLPMIFVCENNLYSTHLPIDQIRTNRKIYEIAKPFDIPASKADGNNVIEVYETMRKAINICKSGHGPVFLEFMTYRMRGHVGPDDNVHGMHTDIRPKDEVTEWLKRDPLKRFERYLMENTMVSELDIAEIKRTVIAEVREAAHYGAHCNRPPKDELNKYVFN